jgi:hypothetical protein
MPASQSGGAARCGCERRHDSEEELPRRSGAAGVHDQASGSPDPLTALCEVLVRV